MPNKIPKDTRIELIHGDIADATVSNTDFSIPRRDVTLSIEDVSLDFDPVAHHERMVLGVLRSDAAKHYESEGFSLTTLREICDDLRTDGHRPGGIIIPRDEWDTFADERAKTYEGEVNAVSAVNFHGWPVVPTDSDGVLDGEAFVFGEQAVTRPQHAPVEILVRHPGGVAQYEF